MYPRIYWELFADHLGPTEHSLGTAGLGDRTDFVGTWSFVVPVAKKICSLERVRAVDMSNTAIDSSCINQ